MRKPFMRGISTDPSIGKEPVGPSRKRKWLIAISIFLTCALLAGGVFAWKTGSLLNRISGGMRISSRVLSRIFPGLRRKLEGEEAGKINILLLGMRGEGMEGGGLLADTIMVLSLHPKQNDQDQTRASLVSIPRDLYVKVPNQDEHRKINAVFALGEQRKPGGGGIEDMRTIVGEVTGQEIPYAVTIDFQGFKDLVNALGGVKVVLDQPFEESLQFRSRRFAIRTCSRYQRNRRSISTSIIPVRRELGTFRRSIRFAIIRMSSAGATSSFRRGRIFWMEIRLSASLVREKPRAISNARNVSISSLKP
jgi:LCP family protein required for cell wall assembly